MPTDPWQHPKVVALLSRLQQVQPSGNGRKSLCPSHPDQNPSLQIDVDTDEGRILAHCHAGCDTASILRALNLTWSDLFLAERQELHLPVGRGEVVAEYTYTDEQGHLLYQKLRYRRADGGKTFRARRPDGEGWKWGLTDTRRVVYHLDEIQGQPLVYIPEGEKDVDNLRALGLKATCNDGGASADGARPKWTPDHTQQLFAAGVQTVVVLPDADSAGEAHAGAITRSCLAAGIQVKVVRFPVMAEHGDVSDWLGQGHAVDELQALVEAQSPETMEAPEVQGPAPESSSIEQLLGELANMDDPWVFLRRIREDVRAGEGQLCVDGIDMIQQRARFIPRWYEIVADQSESDRDLLISEGIQIFKGLTKDTARRAIDQVREHDHVKQSFVVDVEPAVDPVDDGAALLDEVVTKLREFIWVNDEQIYAMALWIAHTHAYANFDYSPFLALESPTKRSGKSRAQVVCSGMVNRSLFGSNISTPALYRSIEHWRPSLFVDEIETFLPANDEMRGVINAGHCKQTAFVIRCQGEESEPTPFSVYSPKCLAGNGELPDTIRDRSIVIRMKRKLGAEHVRPWVRGDRIIRNELLPLARKLARWVQDIKDQLEADPLVPPELQQENDRAVDNWRPLFSLADAAGGEWPARVRHAALTLSGAEAVPDTTPKAVLLADIRRIFEHRQADRLSSADIVGTLVSRQDRVWASWERGKPLTQAGLAALLREFGIQPRNIAIGDTRPKGYMRADLEDAWTRYAPPDHESVAPPTSGNSRYSPENASQHVENVGSSGVAAVAARSGGVEALRVLGKPIQPYGGGVVKKPLTEDAA